MREENKDFPGAIEARRILKIIGYTGEKDGCVFFGLHEYYLRNRVIAPIAGSDGKEKGVDLPEYVLRTMRLALKLYCQSNCNLTNLCPKSIVNLDYDAVLKFINKKGFSEKMMKEIGVFDRRTFKWAYRYVEMKKLLDSLPKIPQFYSIALKDYLNKMGMSVFRYSSITQIPYPSLAIASRQLPYHCKLAELMYRYLIYVGSKIDITKPFELDFTTIFWKNLAPIVEEKEALWTKLTGKHVRKKAATTEVLSKMENESEKQKAKMDELSEKLNYTYDDFHAILCEEKITIEDIMRYANCELKRIIWHNRILSWSVCYSRLLRKCIDSGINMGHFM